MSKINYLNGDATKPQGDGIKLICHITNDLGGWGLGFVLAISKRWKEPEAMYRSHKENHFLGNVDLIQVEKDIYVANMCAQRGMGMDENGKPPIRYGALRTSLNKVNYAAKRLGATIHMPMIGAGLAGGDWNKIEKIIEEECTVPTYVYKF